MGTFPGLAIFSAVLAFNFMGDSLRDFFDPRRRASRGSAREPAARGRRPARAPTYEREPLDRVDGIGYTVEPSEVFGIAGESGSGKTMSVLALMGLLPPGARRRRARAFRGARSAAAARARAAAAERPRAVDGVPGPDDLPPPDALDRHADDRARAPSPPARAARRRRRARSRCSRGTDPGPGGAR